MIEFEKEDLIVPTFLLALLTFLMVLGTPTVDSKRVEEVRTFTVDTNNVYTNFRHDGLKYQQYHWFSKNEIACSSEVYLTNGTVLHQKGVTPVVAEGYEGRCAVFVTVEKTVVEIYGFEVVLPQAVTPVFGISWDDGGDL